MDEVNSCQLPSAPVLGVDNYGCFVVGWYCRVRCEDTPNKTPQCCEVVTAQHPLKGWEANMVEAEVKVKTKKQLLAEMKTATDAGDWKAVSKISSEIAKAVAADEKAEKDAKLAVVSQLTNEVKGLFDTLVAQLNAEHKLDACDGVWYSSDFGEKLTTCRLLKGAARKSGGGSGGGKKFSITTHELLAKHGSEMMGESGKTFLEAYDEDTGGNSRYKVRMKLLKAEGLS
ncbi:MAG: hypothetical protein NWE89_14650 [Candidatus Bathyarchaeota archaeon]|nr:hypothetical protein [Candidatus Bathyarchaeota archaeon]